MKSLKVIKIVSAIVLAVVLIACLVTMIASSYYGFNEMYAVFSVFLSVGLFIFAACVVFLLCSIVAVCLRRVFVMFDSRRLAT